MRRACLALFSAGIALASVALAAQIHRDEANKFYTVLPDGWVLAPPTAAAPFTITSPDGGTQCDVTSMAQPGTANLTQEQINKGMAASYSRELWMSQFFTGGRTGQINAFGVTPRDGFEAAWASGSMAQPGDGRLLYFTTVILMTPGRMVRGYCSGDIHSMPKNVTPVMQTMDNLRPIP